MKFVTIMDMWLLICNMVLLGAILIYGRRVIKLMKRTIDNNQYLAARREREVIIDLIDDEITMVAHEADMLTGTAGYAIATEKQQVLEELRETIRQRNRKNG
jgi:hypothetical protein